MEIMECVNSIDVPRDVEIVGRLGDLERQRGRLYAEQLELACEIFRLRVAERVAEGLPQARWEVGVASEVGLALSVSQNRGAALLSRARALRRCLPHTLARLREGELSPERADVIISGVAHLEPHLQEQADRELCADPQALAGLGVRSLHDRVFQVAAHLDQQAMVDRLAKAEQHRRVTLRPEPDAMVRLSLLLPVAQGVAVFAALKRRADAIAGVGSESRSRTQIMADKAFELITGVDAATGPAVSVNLTMPDSVLFGDGAGEAFVGGGGPIPAEVARNLVARAAAAGMAWVRRLYIRPDSGALVAMDSRSRLFPTGLADAIRARDRYCRTPYCDAPIAYIDHVVPHAAGGETAAANGQGLCAACNYA